jgi:hypothetical protein
MYTQFNSRVNSIYSSRWHFDAGYAAIATFVAHMTAFVVTMKETGESANVNTLSDVNNYVADQMENFTNVELWKAGLRTRFH